MSRLKAALDQVYVAADCPNPPCPPDPDPDPPLRLITSAVHESLAAGPPPPAITNPVFVLQNCVRLSPPHRPIGHDWPAVRPLRSREPPRGPGAWAWCISPATLRLKRRVAIKVLADGRVADELARTRFRREAQALSRLNHPNIATIYDFDQQDGRDFLVMEYIEGQSLRDVGPNPLPAGRCRRGSARSSPRRSSPRTAPASSISISKPGNMMLTADGRLKVLDFGIARLHAPDVGDALDADAARSTPTGGDQRRHAALHGARAGRRRPGRSPAPTSTPRARRSTSSPPDTACSTSRAAPASTRRSFATSRMPPSRHNPGIPAPLEDALMKALEKQPGKRQQTAQELLRRFPGLADGPARPSRFRRLARWTPPRGRAHRRRRCRRLAVTGYALWPAPVRRDVPRARLRARRRSREHDGRSAAVAHGAGGAVDRPAAIEVRQPRLAGSRRRRAARG